MFQLGATPSVWVPEREDIGARSHPSAITNLELEWHTKWWCCQPLWFGDWFGETCVTAAEPSKDRLYSYSKQGSPLIGYYGWNRTKNPKMAIHIHAPSWAHAPSFGTLPQPEEASWWVADAMQIKQQLWREETRDIQIKSRELWILPQDL